MTKSILITGASSGIGHATALEFLNAGWTVGLLARRADRLEDLANTYGNAVPLPADVTNEAEIDTAFDSFVAQAGRLDAMFNNAGVSGPQATIDEVSLDDFQQVVSVNLTGMFLAARAGFRHMRAQSPQGGRIINNGSISAYVPRPLMVCYTTTKHAITGMTRQLSLDGRPLNIACGQIDIGNAGTQMVQEMNDILVQRGEKPNPVMDVTEAARAVLHMAELPLETNVQFMTIMATQMPYIGRG